jgi:hypothetical protein
MPQEANKKWGQDSFDSDKSAGKCSPHVHGAGDAHLTQVLNPTTVNGKHVTNEYPKPSGNYPK